MKIWMDCGTKLNMSPKVYSKMSIECFTLAQRFLPNIDKTLKAKLSYRRATSILTLNEPTHDQLPLATRDARTYVEQCPSIKVILM